MHVKLDTGMGRLGTRDADEASRRASRRRRRCGSPALMTHFATADEDDPASSTRSSSASQRVESRRHPGVLVHAANSAATLAEPAARLDMVRCGVAIYGIDPFQRDPAAQGWSRRSSCVATSPRSSAARPGESAGYGRRFVAERETWLGTIPIGYGDGYRRGLTNNAEVLVDGRRVPLVGTVSMDNITVDLGRRAGRARAPRRS